MSIMMGVVAVEFSGMLSATPWRGTAATSAASATTSATITAISAVMCLGFGGRAETHYEWVPQGQSIGVGTSNI